MTGEWWIAPRRRDEFMWWQKELIDPDTGNMIKYAYITWLANGKGGYSVSVNFEREGWGLHHWPNFKVLSEAETLADMLMEMDIITARQYINEHHGVEIHFE